MLVYQRVCLGITHDILIQSPWPAPQKKEKTSPQLSHHRGPASLVGSHRTYRRVVDFGAKEEAIAVHHAAAFFGGSTPLFRWLKIHGHGSIPINTIFRGNEHPFTS